MASDRPASPPCVVLDATLLYPFQLRNLLVQLGVDSVIAPRWTARINEERITNLVAAGRVPRDRLLRTLDLMNTALPDAEVFGWETRMAGLVLPDPDDCHVLAAALAANAEMILTMNLRDFPSTLLDRCGIMAAHPDNFLCDLCDAQPDLIRSSVQAAHTHLSRSLPTFLDYLDALGRRGLSGLAERLRRR